MTLSNTTVPFTACVLEHMPPGIDVILGQSFLRAHTAAVVFRTDTLDVSLRARAQHISDRPFVLRVCLAQPHERTDHCI